MVTRIGFGVKTLALAALMGWSATAGEAALPDAFVARVALARPPATFERMAAFGGTALSGTPLAYAFRAGLVDELLDMDDDFDRILPLLAPDRPVEILFGMYRPRKDVYTLMRVRLAPAAEKALAGPEAEVQRAFPGGRWQKVPPAGDDDKRNRWLLSDRDGDDALALTRLPDGGWLVTDALPHADAAANETERWPAPAFPEGARFIVEVMPERLAGLLGRDAEEEYRDAAEEFVQYAAGPLPAVPPLPAGANAKEWERAFAAFLRRVDYYRMDAGPELFEDNLRMVADR